LLAFCFLWMNLLATQRSWLSKLLPNKRLRSYLQQPKSIVLCLQGDVKIERTERRNSWTRWNWFLSRFLTSYWVWLPYHLLRNSHFEIYKGFNKWISHDVEKQQVLGSGETFTENSFSVTFQTTPTVGSDQWRTQKIFMGGSFSGIG